jgi:hypothetical protein
MINLLQFLWRGTDWLGKKRSPGGQANITGMPPNQKVNKAEQTTYLSITKG